MHFFPGITPEQWQDWRWQRTNSLTSLEELQQRLALPADSLAGRQATQQRYPLLVTPYYLSLAESNDCHDPILRQCLPDPAELQDGPGEPDALAEERSSPVPRLVHRYPDRALFITGNYCAVHCRHCMRKRHWSLDMGSPSRSEIKAAAEYMRHQPGLREVLISGGDPLLLPETVLAEIIAEFSAVENIQTLRFGSRLPVTLPQRLEPDFCRLLASGKPAWLATHFNHARELTPEAAQAADNLLRAGIPVVNQTVLLKGINDTPEALSALLLGLLRLKIKPYYLFHGDPIAGTMHFRTGVEKGLELLDALRGRISGLALPAYAFDLPHGAGKIRLEPDVTLGKNSAGEVIYRNYAGLAVPYF
jgi:lysine 2,3-aminomutase